MTCEFIYEKAGVEKKLDTNMQSNLVEKISRDYDNWQEARLEQLQKSEELINEIFFKNDFSNTTSKKNWKAKAKVCKVYMLYQTLKAYIWRNVYSKPGSMFDVSGENNQSDSNSNRQKAALVDVFEKMKLVKRLDKIIDNSLLYGDLLAFVGWKKNTKQVRRPLNFFEKLVKLNFNENTEGFVTEDVNTYDNPYVYEVNPVNFVFDTTQIDNWDNCPKILKSFKSPEEIMNNSLYRISRECKEMLVDFISSTGKSNTSSSFSNQNAYELRENLTNGDGIEILEHWGNIRLGNGELLTNMHVVVLARKYIIRFEKNKFVENPFVYGYYLIDPDTKRSISPLQSIYDLAMMQESLYNRTLDMQSLNENPPIYAPKGFFTDAEIELYPGKVIVYDPNLYQNVPLTPMNFKSDIYLKDIVELDKIIADVSGIYPNMSGQLDKNNVTATEVAVKTQGQNIRLAMLIDIINQDLILPIVEKTAALLANFKFMPEILYVNKDGKNETLIVDNDVRQGSYQYSYSDRNSLMEKMNNAENTALAFEKFASVLPMNWQEVFKWYWEQKGVENPERFLAQGNMNVAPSIIEAIKSSQANQNNIENEVKKDINKNQA